MERRYGKSNRIWVMDRGMVSEDNMKFLRKDGRRYIVGTPILMLKKFEQDILKEDWHSIHDGFEVKIVPWPKSDDDDASEECDSSPERFILWRSRERSKKEEAITQRFEKKIEELLTRMNSRCEKQKRDPNSVHFKTHLERKTNPPSTSQCSASQKNTSKKMKTQNQSQSKHSHSSALLPLACNRSLNSLGEFIRCGASGR